MATLIPLPLHTTFECLDAKVVAYNCSFDRHYGAIYDILQFSSTTVAAATAYKSSGITVTLIYMVASYTMMFSSGWLLLLLLIGQVASTINSLPVFIQSNPLTADVQNALLPNQSKSFKLWLCMG